jgi:hypothetical protein
VKIPKALLIAVVALVVAAAVGGYCVDAKFREWNERVEEVVRFAEEETARADSAVAEADVWQSRADSIAIEAEARSPIIRERIRLVRDSVPVPDTCYAVVAQRDSLIDEALAEADDWRLAYAAEKAAAEALRSGYNSLLVVNDSLLAVLDDRPRPRPRWAPSLQMGVFAGVCSDGRPCVGAGAGLTVEVKIPIPW